LEKSNMKKLLLAAVLMLGCANLGACQTIPEAFGAETATIGAEMAEAAARERCPQSSLELALLLGSRIGFDQAAGDRLAPAQQARIDAARAETDRVCSA
jgi:predicted small secreted protein